MTGIRPAWHFDMICCCQHLAGSLVRPYTEPEETVLARIVRSALSPQGPVELNLQSSLFRTCVQRWALLAHHLYRLAHGRCRRLDDPGGHWDDAISATSPADAMVAWATSYFAAFRKEHPAPLPFRVIGTVEASYDTAATVQQIARQCEISTRRLKRILAVFCRRSFHAYRKELRIAREAELLRTTDIKVEAIALLVGFRSKKSLYVAVRSAFDGTPGALRVRSNVASGRNPLRSLEIRSIHMDRDDLLRHRAAGDLILERSGRPH